MKEFTLIYLIRENKICLARKEIGLGAGYYNGFGGKVEEDETIEQCALRELEEESGVWVSSTNSLEKIAVNTFYLSKITSVVHTFFVRDWKGVLTDSNEMKIPHGFPSKIFPIQRCGKVTNIGCLE